MQVITENIQKTIKYGKKIGKNTKNHSKLTKFNNFSTKKIIVNHSNDVT